MSSIRRLDAEGRPIPKGSQDRPVKYRVRWRTPSGASRSKTVKAATEAQEHLTRVDSSKLTGSYVERSAGAVTLGEWFDRWVVTRRTSSGEPLRPKTAALYRYLFNRHIAPTFGNVRIRDIAPGEVREWHGRLEGSTVPAKAYRLLGAMLNTAVDDELTLATHVASRAQGSSGHPSGRYRPVMRCGHADAIGERWRAIVLTSAFAGLRWGELMGLQRGDVDLDAATITVESQVLEVGRDQIEGPPKTDAGRRTVAMPMVLVPELRAHLERFVAPDPSARVFVGAKGATPRTSNFARLWQPARAAVGREDLHFHDLRHFANTLAASAGASTKELMARLGHASPAAALRYQHATGERDRAIADRMDDMIGPRSLRPAASER